MATRPQVVYDDPEKAGVTAIAIAGFLSLSAALVVLTVVAPRTKTFKRTHILGYFISLLISNIIQGTGTAMNLKWIIQGSVQEDSFCMAQGAIKQFGNLANAVWTLSIAVHMFDIVFLRHKTSKTIFYAVLVLCWTLIGMFVILGPAALQKKELGPYFGISGSWCWITAEYDTARLYLEYFFEYLAAGISVVLYSIILLRVRGNLVIKGGKPRLRFVPSSDRWQLALVRDYIDSTMINIIHRMIWFPVAYMVIIVPIGAARLSEFAGAKVPAWVTFTTAFIFNLTGVVNVILFFTTDRLFPQTPLPEFNTRRHELGKSVMNHGVTPFVMNRSDTATGTGDSHQMEEM